MIAIQLYVIISLPFTSSLAAVTTSDFTILQEKSAMSSILASVMTKTHLFWCVLYSYLFPFRISTEFLYHLTSMLGFEVSHTSSTIDFSMTSWSCSGVVKYTGASVIDTYSSHVKHASNNTYNKHAYFLLISFKTNMCVKVYVPHLANKFSSFRFSNFLFYTFKFNTRF